ncbi:hypothetical protein HMPREF0262_01948 [Clostridium sp. ATCC 29733]|nr:hypothetical protein HMPREF0262_01948 [Clostridium sp. ATCC 29733]
MAGCCCAFFFSPQRQKCHDRLNRTQTKWVESIIAQFAADV